jgi:Ser/Thr protein kinase RdoA (MazF antagonist)
MTTFPVTHSNLSATHLAAYLQAHYAFDGSVACKLIRSGINDTYLVTDAVAKYVFRVYSLGWRTEVEIREEIRLLNLLHAHALPVSYALTDRVGAYIHTLPAPEGARMGVLFTYAHGSKLHNMPATTHFQIGQWMAQLHRVTQDLHLDRVHYTTEVLLDDPMVEIAGFLSADADEMVYLRALLAYLQLQFQGADASQVRVGAVHLDIWMDNLNVDAAGNVTLFDFDFCGNGWLCMDIAYYVLQLHNIERDPAQLAPKLDAFLAGYEAVTAINAEEKRLLPMLGLSLYIFYLGVQCRRYDNWSNSFLSETYLKRFIIALVQRYADLQGIHVDGTP